MTSTAPRTYLLTGATGFVGKVILHELIRRKDAHSLAAVILVIRSRGRRSASQRFLEEIVASPCCAGLPAGWTSLVQVLDGDLADAAFGRSQNDRAVLGGVTHVIHAAAAVSFTLPGPIAARANITTSLNLMRALEGCPALERIVYVSTAFVSPHREGRIPAALVPLERSAADLYADLQEGTSKDADVLARSGHPNTYTLTKAITEHLLIERRPPVPLTIVRPSIVTASREQPMPGWIDSHTGFGAFVTLIGLGHLRAVVGHRDARLDLIPVDDVAEAILDACLRDDPGVTVRHAVAGLARAPTVHECWDEIDRHFKLHPVDRIPARRYLGPRGSTYVLADLIHHRLPIAFARLQSARRRRQTRKIASRLAYLNDVFPYFTTRSFDFETDARPGEPFDSRALVACVCKGVSRHLFGVREDEWVAGGRTHIPPTGDLRWVWRQPKGNALIRITGWLVVKVLRRTTDAVTVDVPSFERARDSAPEGAALVLVPSHRSFFDFVLCSYLAFSRPDLGIGIPHVAAAIEFGNVPLLGRLLRSAHAFYVTRGAARENRDLSRRVHDLLAEGEVIEFFVEGQRSRSRAFLPPKRGLLRCVAASGRPVVLLPIAISYDRVPEEATFARELAGSPKPRMRFGALLGWLVRVWRGRVQLGRMHMACGRPIALDASADIHAAADAIIDELRGAMAVTSFHLDAYAAGHPEPGFDAPTLRARIEAAGGRVLESRLAVPPDLDPLVARTMREHFARFIEPPSTPGGEPPAPYRIGDPTPSDRGRARLLAEPEGG